MATIDSLDIQIAGSAKKANDAVNSLVKNLDKLANSLKIDTSGLEKIGQAVDLSEISNGVKDIQKQMSGFEKSAKSSMNKVSKSIDEVVKDAQNIGKGFRIEGNLSAVEKGLQKYTNELERAKLKEKELSAKGETDTAKYRDAVVDIQKYSNIIESIKKQLQSVKNTDILPEIKISGANDFKKSLDEYKKELEDFKNDIKSIGDVYGGLENISKGRLDTPIENLKTTIEELKSAYPQATNVISAFEKELQRVQAVSSGLTKENISVNVDMGGLKKAENTIREKISSIQNLFRNSGMDFVFEGNSEQLEKEIQKVGNELDNLFNKQDRMIELGKVDTDSFKGVIRDIENAANRLKILEDARPDALNRTLEETQKKAKESETALGEMNAKLKKLVVPPIREDNLNKLQSMLKKAEEELERLRVKLKNGLAMGTIKKSAEDKGFQNLSAQIVVAEKRTEMLRHKIQDIGGSEKSTAGLEALSDSFKKLGTAAGKAATTIKSALKGVASIVSGAFSKIGQIGSRIASTIKNVASSISSSFAKIGSSSKNLEKAHFNIKNLLKTVIGFKAIKGIFDFGKDAIKLGSDITEVENVVDTAFGSMAGHAYAFAATAKEQFGLSELAAKQYSGTMMAMLKSSGFDRSEDMMRQAAKMSTTLAGLAGDIASFYNIETDEAFYKLRSAISGETEPMKALGVNMNIVNLEAFAMSRGITKAYKDMTLAEQATLRYNYILAKTTDAQGDFAKTSGTWANQLRLLKLNFESISAVIGQGLIAAILPAIKWLNALMSKLMEAAKVFRSFMYTLFGKVEGSQGGVVDDLAGSLEDVGDEAEDAGKKIKKNLLLPIDELNILSEETKLEDDLGIGDFDIGDFELDEFEEIDTTPISKWAQAIRDAILAQDWEGLGKTLAELVNAGLQKIYDAIKAITPKVEKALKNFAKVFNSFVKWLDWDLLGKTIGAGINLIVKAFNALFGDDGINLELLGEKLSTGLRGMIEEVNWQELGNAIGNYLMIAWRIAYGFIEDMWRINPETLLTGWAEAGIAIGETLAGIFERIDFVKISSVLTEGFKGVLERFTFALNTFSDNLDWIVDKINLGLDRLYDGLKWDSTAGQDMGDKITAFTDSISTAFNKLLELDFGRVGQIIGAGITDIVRAFNQLTDISGGIDFEGIGTNLSNALRGLVTEIPWGELGNALGNGFMAAWRILDGFLSDMAKKSDAGLTGWQEIGVSLGNAINGLFSKIDLNTISSSISGLVNGIASIIYEAFSSIDWGGLGTEIGQSIKKTLEDIDFTELGRTLGTVFQSAVDFLKGIISQISFKDVVDAIMSLLKGFFEEANWEDVSSVILTAFGGSLINMLPEHIKMIGFATAVIYLFADEFKKVDWTSVGETLAESINNFLSNIDGSRLAKGASDLMNGLFEAISSCIKNIDWSQVWEIIIEFLTSIDYLDALMLPVKFAEIGFYFIAGLIQGLVEAIFNTDWSQVWNDILDTFKEFFGIHSPSTVMEEQGGFLMQGLINGVMAFVENVVESFRTLVDEIKKALEKKWNELVEWWNNNAVSKWWNESVKPWFTKEKWSELYDSIKKSLEEKWNELVGWWQQSGVKKWIDDDVKPWFTVEKWKETYDSVKKGLVDKWEELRAWWKNTNFSEWIDNYVKPWFTKEKWSEIYSNVKKKFEDKWGELKTWWKNADFSEWIKDHVNPHFLSDKWEKIYEPVKSSLETKWGQLTTWWNNSAMGKWFENDVKPWFSEKNWTWDGIKEGLGSSFDSAIEGVKSIWNGFAEWLNSILKFEIPEVDIPLVGKVGGFTIDLGKLPTFATGGHPNFSSPFLVGENGPEIMGGMYGKPTVANRDSITDGIRQASYEGMMQAISEMFPYLADIAENTRRTAEKDMSVNIGDRDIYNANKRGAARAGMDFSDFSLA